MPGLVPFAVGGVIFLVSVSDELSPFLSSLRHSSSVSLKGLEVGFMPVSSPVLMVDLSLSVIRIVHLSPSLGMSFAPGGSLSMVVSVKFSPLLQPVSVGLSVVFLPTPMKFSPSLEVECSVSFISGEIHFVSGVVLLSPGAISGLVSLAPVSVHLSPSGNPESVSSSSLGEVAMMMLVEVSSPGRGDVSSPSDVDLVKVLVSSHVSKILSSVVTSESFLISGQELSVVSPVLSSDDSVDSEGSSSSSEVSSPVKSQSSSPGNNLSSESSSLFLKSDELLVELLRSTNVLSSLDLSDLASPFDTFGSSVEISPMEATFLSVLFGGPSGTVSLVSSGLVGGTFVFNVLVDDLSFSSVNSIDNSSSHVVSGDSCSLDLGGNVVDGSRHSVDDHNHLVFSSDNDLIGESTASL